MHVPRNSGIPTLGPLPWGSHFCQFYQTADDLLDVLIPYFQAGLEANEYCMWVTSAPLLPEQVVHAMRARIAGFDGYLAERQMEIVSHANWYLTDGKFDASRVLQGWADRLAQAQRRGFSGLRLTGNTFWLEHADWNHFMAYESEVGGIIANNRIVALCAYPLEHCNSAEVIDVVARHQFALIKREGAWEMIESAARREALVLREARSSYLYLFENMIDGFAYHRVITNDRHEPVDYLFLEANEAFERHTGLDCEAIIGKRVTEVLPGIEHDTADWIGTFGRVALTGEALRVEQYSETLDKWYSVMAYSPKPGHFATVFKDISARKSAEKEIQSLNEDLNRNITSLEAANRELESFAYSVSHDLIAPLRSINGFSQILLDEYGDLLDSDGHRILQRVRGSSEHMSRLIDALLELSRLTRTALSRETVDLSGLARRIAGELTERDSSRQVGFLIQPDIITEADPAMLLVVLESLLGNAWKFTRGRERACIQISSEGPAASPRICVRDNGVGFDMAYSRKLFSAFHRLHDNDHFPGLGIGLATVYRIVQRHGGHIWAEATPGEGAAFWFTLQPSAAAG